MLDLREIARVLGGEVQGRQALVPGPNHGRLDRSLSVRLSSSSPMGFVVHSFADDPFDSCRDYVAQRLGLDLDGWRTHRQDGGARPAPVFTVPKAGPEPDRERRIARAAALWAEADDAHGTIVETYLAGRGLELPPGADVLRFHRSCPWRDDDGAVVYVPAMLACMRAIDGDAIQAIHRTRLGPDATKLGRKMLGIASGAAIKLDADDAVTHGLTIGEGVETVLSGRPFGFCPAWALASAGAIASFPVLGGVEALTILAENDPASDRAVGHCMERWSRAGREVHIVTPTIGSDLNDALRGVTA